jgi:hypothetical protein
MDYGLPTPELVALLFATRETRHYCLTVNFLDDHSAAHELAPGWLQASENSEIRGSRKIPDFGKHVRIDGIDDLSELPLLQSRTLITDNVLVTG